METFSHIIQQTPIKWPQHLWSPARLAALVISLLYILQLASPLRINTDATTFLSMAANAEVTGSFYPDYDSTRYPLGYPFLIVQLGKVGLANSPGLIALNLISLAAMMGIFGSIKNEKAASHVGWPSTSLVILVSLCSFAVIKHVTLPLSDFTYLIFAYGALYAVHGALGPVGNRQAVVRYMAAAVSIALAFSVRNAAVCLIPSILMAVALRKGSIHHLSPRRLMTWRNARWLIPLALVLLIVLGLIGVAVSRQQLLVDFFTEKVLSGAFASVWHGRVVELGELLLNVPASRLGSMPGASVILLLAGMTAMAVVAADLWGRRKELDVLDCFLIFNIALLAAWPHNDVRFWIPVIPVLARNFLLGVRRAWPESAPKWPFAGAMTVFLAGGLLAMSYSTWLSFSGKDFATRFSSYDRLQRGYVDAYGLPVPVELAAVSAEPDKVAVLRRFEHRYAAPAVLR